MNRIQKATKKLEQSEFVWFEYGYGSDNYIASVAANQVEMDGKHNTITFHKGQMPAFNGENFDTVEALAAKCLELQPDLRKWRTIFES